MSDVEVTEADLAAIPAGNLRVARDEFVAVWKTASARAEERARRASPTGTPAASP